MKNNNSKYKLAVVCFTFYILHLTSFLLHAQEALTDLTINPTIAKQYNEIQNSNLKIIPATLDTIVLPFLDDFSKDNIYPDAGHWLDSNVFINRDYPIAPPTLGVATFDGVSKSGCPYDTTLNNSSALPADILTSKPINLSSLLPSDSVYLSFFWQAKGRGNDPEANDSLLLDFYNPTTQQWKNFWYKNGYDPSPQDTVFRLVSIPITDTAYLKNAFQFRFRNYATISGNVDHWHIDYVLLDKNRSKGDTIFRDVAFVYNSRSLLKNYYAMPWEQYDSTEMKTNLSFTIRNNDTANTNSTFVDTIFNSAGGVECSYYGGSENILPYPPYCNLPQFANPPVSDAPLYSFPSLTKNTSFLLKCVLKTGDNNKWNDTLRFKQNFYNYYAYDDGTVEAGYGLSGPNAYGAQIAYQFTLNNPDTLFALQMLFNWIPPKVSYRQFRIRVWNDAGGIPGSLIYEDSITSPKYQYQSHTDWGNLTNMFYPYKLTSPKALSGTFYVGLIQYCCNGNNELLNIGYDKNTNSNNKIFYNTGNGWHSSNLPAKGSLMIRPVFGDTAGLMAVPEEKTPASDFSVFPNPSNGIINVQCSMFNAQCSIQNVELYNMMGQKVYTTSNNRPLPSNEIDISGKPNGIYFIRIIDEKGITHSQKLVLAK